jgi:hypothetical protein
LYGGVVALAVSGSDLYTGGNFTSAGGSNANSIAKWNGSVWSALGSGMNGPFYGRPSVYAVAVSGSDLYVGGGFTTVGGSVANNIARWNGSAWSALGSGIDGTVWALAVSGSNVYAGGAFWRAGGSEAASIAKWNGSTWSALGSGMSGTFFSPPSVYALAMSGSDLYAGGGFKMAGGIAANRIAKWDGNSWSALGPGISDWTFYSPDWSPVVRALVVSGSDVYAGGSFDAAGGNTATNIAKWNGSYWSALGSGLELYYSVYALAMSGSNLYAGGSFTMAGTTEAKGIAMWNGSSWSALGSGMGGSSPSVSALAVSGSDLYAGGDFTTAGGIIANGIAKWNGSSWSALGAGMGGTYPYVSALAVSGSDPYAGGWFTVAGGKVSAYVARAVVYPPVLAIEPDGSPGYFIRFSGVPGTTYRLQHAPALAGPWDSSAPQAAPASGRVEFRDISPAPGQTFYRVVQP